MVHDVIGQSQVTLGPPDMFKLVHLLHMSIYKRVVGHRLKGLLVRHVNFIPWFGILLGVYINETGNTKSGFAMLNWWP